jgi:hypothetical protein
VLDDGGAVTVNVPYSGWAGTASSAAYNIPWGTLLHASASRTDVQGPNAGAGYDNPLGVVDTSKGGYFMYEVLSGDAGNLTLSVDDSANNVNWLPLGGATSPLIAASAGVSGIVAIGTAAVVRRYLRWQIVFGTSDLVTFVCAFMRAY